MAIIISKNNQNAHRIEESQFNLEDNLQEYVINNPDIVPVYDIDADARLFIAAREFATNSGPIDALGFDQSGNIYIVETKLFKNPDKRTVVAQALDYGASMWRHATDFDTFVSQLDTHTQKQWGTTFKEQYERFFELDDASANLASIKENLAEGRIKFVVLMDSLDERLKDLIVYVNQNSKFDIYAVDFEYYKHDQFEIVIPKLYGSEVKKDVPTRSAGQRRKWSEQEFIAAVEMLDEPKRRAILTLVDWAHTHADAVSYGTGTITGSMNPKFHHIGPRSFTHILTSGEVQISYGYLEPKRELMKKLKRILAAHISVAKITDISDEKLPESEWLAIPADYVAENVDAILEAFNEFIGRGDDNA